MLEITQLIINVISGTIIFISLMGLILGLGCFLALIADDLFLGGRIATKINNWIDKKGCNERTG